MINGIGDQAFMTAFLNEDEIEEAQDIFDRLQDAEKAGNKKKAKRLEKRLESFNKKQLESVQALIEADSVKNGGTGALEAWFNKIINLDPDSDQYLSQLSDEEALAELQSGVGKEFYEKYNKYGRAWFMTQYGPGDSDEDVEYYKQRAEEDIRTELGRLGIDPDGVDVSGMVDEYYLNGYQAGENRELFNKALITKYGDGGVIETQRNYGDELRAAALANGVRRDESWFQNAEQRIALGDTNLNMYEEEFRNEAASRYPLFTQKLQSGENLWDIASPWRQALQDVLEYSPTDIFDPHLAYAMEGQMGDDGMPSAMTLYDYKKYLRNQPEWEKTTNGRKTIDSTLSDLATMFGIGF